MDMPIAEDVRKSVRESEAEIARLRERFVWAAAERDRVAREIDRLWKSMDFRERRLRGAFGGDKKKVALRRVLKAQLPKLEADAASLKRDADAADRGLRKFLERSLAETDPDYQTLLQPYWAALGLKKTVDGYLGKIDAALEEVREAHGMETMDLFSKNKGIAILSHIETVEAREAIAVVRATGPDFQKSLEEYNDSVKGWKAPALDAEIGDGLDLTFDLLLDGFDFMSVFALSKLNDAEHELQQLRAEVAKIEAAANGRHEKTRAAVDAYVARTRAVCAAAGPYR
jgi:phage shock protein A